MLALETLINSVVPLCRSCTKTSSLALRSPAMMFGADDTKRKSTVRRPILPAFPSRRYRAE